jgi:YHS domain-containing protein
MNVILKSTWTVLILGAAAGCAGDTEPAAPPVDASAAPVVSKPATGTSTPVNENANATASRDELMPAPADGTKATDAKKGDEAPKVEGPKAENTKPGPGAAKLTADELAAIKELPASEQATALAQVDCPVSSHHLGSMGMPLKVTALGRTFYLCCDSCEEKLKADPKAVIAKLDQKKAGK